MLSPLNRHTQVAQFRRSTLPADDRVANDCPIDGREIIANRGTSFVWLYII